MDQFPKSKAEFVDEVGLELTTIPIPKCRGRHFHFAKLYF